MKNASYILGAFLIGVLYLVLTLYKNVVHSKPSFLSDFSIVDTSAKWSRTNLKLKDYIVLGVVLRLVSWNSSTWTEYTVGSVATAAAIENSLQSTILFRSIIAHQGLALTSETCSSHQQPKGLWISEFQENQPCQIFFTAH